MPFEMLEGAFRASSPRYPCCPRLHNGSKMRQDKCHIDDQHCLQSAILLASTPLSYAIDSNASLFLNLNGVPAAHLLRDEISGACVYAPTGVAPCVLHSNGKAAKPLMARVFECMDRSSAWIVPAGSNPSAAALFRVTH